MVEVAYQGANVNAPENTDRPAPSRQLIIGLALIAGLGLTLMVIALGIGVVEGSNADGSSITILFAAGLALLVSGIIGWIAVVQPEKHFDDITIPAPAEPHGHEHHDDHEHTHGEEHVEEQKLAPTGGSH
jgi:hypothetical protein